MDFTLDSDQQMLKSLVENFVQRRRPAADDGWAELAQTGLLGLPLAIEAGGANAGAQDIAIVMEALGRGMAGAGFLDRIIVAACVLEAAGDAAMRQAWLPGIVAGEHWLALAHAEHAGRFDLAACRTRLADGRLSGTKTHVPGGAAALIVTAVAPAGAGLFLVQGTAAGVSRRSYRLVDGSLAEEVQFDGVAAEALPGGIAALAPVLQMARIAACAEMLGLMGLLLDATLDHVRQRRQFGAPIGSFQAIQHRLADVYVAAEQSRSQLYRCLLAPEAAREAAVAAAKSYISAAAVRLGEECLQFHGGMGMSDDLPIGHAHKRILMLASLFGDADHEQRRYHRALADRARASPETRIDASLRVDPGLALSG